MSLRSAHPHLTFARQHGSLPEGVLLARWPIANCGRCRCLSGTYWHEALQWGAARTGSVLPIWRRAYWVLGATKGAPTAAPKRVAQSARQGA